MTVALIGDLFFATALRLVMCNSGSFLSSICPAVSPFTVKITFTISFQTIPKYQ